MSLNVLGTPNTKSYISANVNSAKVNTLKVRPNPDFEGDMSYQDYTPSVLTTDSPSFLTFGSSQFLYRISYYGAEAQLHILFFFDVTMIGTGGQQRGFTFSLPAGISTATLTELAANGYMIGQAADAVPSSLLNIVSEVTRPADDQVRLLFKNPNQSAYIGTDYRIRGEVILRIL